MSRKTCLRIKVFLLHIIIKLGLKENVWYKCEQELSDIIFDELFKDILEDNIND